MPTNNDYGSEYKLETEDPLYSAWANSWALEQGESGFEQPAPRNVDITVVLDASGSMMPKIASTIRGYNTFLAAQRGTRATVSLVQFSDTRRLIYVGRHVLDAPDLTTRSYIPSGSTALFDALGQSISMTEARLRGTHLTPVFVVITDGEENASHEYTHGIIKAMIEERRAAGWEFIFLGADEKSFTQAMSIGFSVGTTSMYNQYNPASTQSMWTETASMIRSYATGQTDTMNYTDEQRAEMGK